mgnify:CR=1 FL=1
MRMLLSGSLRLRSVVSKEKPREEAKAKNQLEKVQRVKDLAIIFIGPNAKGLRAHAISVTRQYHRMPRTSWSNQFLAHRRLHRTLLIPKELLKVKERERAESNQRLGV